MRQHQTKNDRAALAAAAAFAVIAFLVYLPALWNGSVNWDDPGHVFENPLVRGLDLKGAFTAVVVGNWLPLTLLSYALDYAVWGNEPLGYHLTNNALHSLNAGLVFLVGLRLACARGGTPGIRHFTTAAVASLLFALHPVHVESVAWISERKDVLYAFFFLLSALSYLRYASSSGRGWYLSALLLFALSLMSKPMAVTLPAALLVIDYFPLGRLKGRVFRAVFEKAPFFALSAASSVITILAQRSEGALMPVDSYPLWVRAAVAVRSLGFYVFKAVFPAGLAPYYPLPSRSELLGISFYASVALIVSVVLVSVLASRRTKAFSAAWLYYLVTLMPIIGLVQVGSQAGADRYAYLTLLGPFLLAGSGAGALMELLRARKGAFRGAVAAGLAVFLVLAALTVRQIGFWHDSLSLWNRQIAVYPGKAANVYTLRGLAFDEKKMYREAIRDFDTSIALQPANAFAFNNRGNAYKSLGEFGPAIDDFLKAARLAPELPEPHHNLSVAYSEIGEMELALESAKRAGELGWGKPRR